MAVSFPELVVAFNVQIKGIEEAEQQMLKFQKQMDRKDASPQQKLANIKEGYQRMGNSISDSMKRMDSTFGNLKQMDKYFNRLKFLQKGGKTKSWGAKLGIDIDKSLVSGLNSGKDLMATDKKTKALLTQEEVMDRIARISLLGPKKIKKFLNDETAFTKKQKELNKPVTSKGSKANDIFAVSKELDDLNDKSEFLVKSGFGRQLGVGFNKTGEIIDTTSDKVLTLKDVNKKMFNQGIQFNKDFTRGFRKHNEAIGKARQGMQWFRMEFLGIMFAGMAMQKAFQGLLRPALESAGAFEVMGEAIQTVLSPAVEAIMPSIEWLAEKMEGMSEGWKMFYGVLALSGLVIGTFIFIVGQAGLAFLSFLKMFTDIKEAGGLRNYVMQLSNIDVEARRARLAVKKLNFEILKTSKKGAFGPLSDTRKKEDMKEMTRSMDHQNRLIRRQDKETKKLAKTEQHRDKAAQRRAKKRRGLSGTRLMGGALTGMMMAGGLSELFKIDPYDIMENLEGSIEDITDFIEDGGGGTIGELMKTLGGLSEQMGLSNAGKPMDFMEMLFPFKLGMGKYTLDKLGISDEFNDFFTTLYAGLKIKWDEAKEWFIESIPTWDDISTTLTELDASMIAKWGVMLTGMSTGTSGFIKLFTDNMPSWDDISEALTAIETNIKTVIDNIVTKLETIFPNPFAALEGHLKTLGEKYDAMMIKFGLMKEPTPSGGSGGVNIGISPEIEYTNSQTSVDLPQSHQTEPVKQWVDYLPKLMANGGLVTSPTFGLMGEAGPEAIIPLNKLGDMMGGNSVGDVTINVNVDGSGSNMNEEMLADRIGDIVLQKLRNTVIS